MISVGNNAHTLQTDKMHFCTFPGHTISELCTVVWVLRAKFGIYLSPPQVEFRSSLHMYSFHVLQDEHEITLEELYTRLETNPDEVCVHTHTHHSEYTVQQVHNIIRI